MKKFSTQFSIIVVLMIFIFPSITMAAWWNHMAWFTPKVKVVPVQMQQPLPQTVQSKEAQPINTSVPREIIIEKPIIQEKIVTKTITVDNPELQKRIDVLIVENNGLRKLVTDSSANLNTMSGQYNDVLAKYNSMNNAFPVFTEKLKTMIKAAFDVQNAKLNECRSALGLALTMPPPVYIPTPTYYPPINNTIHCTSSTLFNTTYTNCY